jgi:hypothetical protein
VNVVRFRKMTGDIVVFRPRPKVKSGLLDEPTNSWIIVHEVEDRTFLFRNRITNHEVRLGIDSIEKFHTPKFLLLRGQLTLKDGGKTEFEPFIRGIGLESSKDLTDHNAIRWTKYGSS